jgi:hypothetical protein
MRQAPAATWMVLNSEGERAVEMVRRLRGIGHREVARRIGCTTASLLLRLRGNVEMPPGSLEQLAQALECGGGWAELVELAAQLEELAVPTPKPDRAAR